MVIVVVVFVMLFGGVWLGVWVLGRKEVKFVKIE